MKPSPPKATIRSASSGETLSWESINNFSAPTASSWWSETNAIVLNSIILLLNCQALADAIFGVLIFEAGADKIARFSRR